MVAVMRGGGLAVKVFTRTAKLEEKSLTAGAPIAQSQKLNIPRKTKVFVDQTIREREEGRRIHQIFQREQFSLRLAVARDYVAMLDAKLNPVAAAVEQSTKKTAGEGSSAAASRDGADTVQLTAAVQGLLDRSVFLRRKFCPVFDAFGFSHDSFWLEHLTEEDDPMQASARRSV